MQQAGNHTVEEVKHSPYDNKEQSQLELILEGEIGCDAT